LKGKARIFWIASLHVTKPGYIISLRNQNEHQSSGSMRIHNHPKNFGQLHLQVKWTTSVFWEKHGVIHVDFLLRGATINSEYYCRVLSDVLTRLRKKKSGLITKGVLFLQDNARAHTAHRTTCTLQQLGEGGIATSRL